jgi:hypothetical protein
MSSVFLSSLFLSVFAGSELGLAILLRGFFGALRTNLVSYLAMHGNFMGCGINAESISGISRNCLAPRCYSSSQLSVSKPQADKSFRVMLPVWVERERTYKSEQCQPRLVLT